MKRFLLIISALSSTTLLFAQTQIGNGNLENWDNVGSSTEEPVNWNSFKTGTGSVSGLFGSTTIARSTAVRPGTGTYCARIWSKSTLSIIANGNLTLGRIEMGNAISTSASNYNYSITSNTAFSEALTDSPDSLVFWVKYTNGNSASMARVSAVLHDTYDYRDGYNVHAPSAPYKVAEISHNYPSTGGNWVRKSIPWDYTGPASSHTFVLITFTTNMTPGGGNENDEVLIDDVELIYNPVVTNLPVVAVNDAANTFEDLAVDIDVLANDTDPEDDFDIAGITITTAPSNGNVAINTTTGVITYTPNAGYFGTDMFEYEICDNGTPVYCDIATVNINILEVIVGNNPIVAVNDNVSTNMNTSIIIAVTANDVDFENDIDNPSLAIVANASNGSTTINTVTGEITYTPNTNFSGFDSFTYSICDGGTPTTCDQAIVFVNVINTSGIEENELENISVSVSNGVLYVQSLNELEATYYVYSSLGTLVQEGTVVSKMNFYHPAGIYFVHIQNSKGELIRKVISF
jgi:hypothetical protein